MQKKQLTTCVSCILTWFGSHPNADLRLSEEMFGGCRRRWSQQILGAGMVLATSPQPMTARLVARSTSLPTNQKSLFPPFSDPSPPTTCMGEGGWCVMQYHPGYIRSVLHSRHQSLNPPPPHLSFKYFRPGKRWHLFKSVENARGAFVFAIEIRTARSL